jgi:hypothetical protein
MLKNTKKVDEKNEVEIKIIFLSKYQKNIKIYFNLILKP